MLFFFLCNLVPLLGFTLVSQSLTVPSWTLARQKTFQVPEAQEGATGDRVRFKYP